MRETFTSGSTRGEWAAPLAGSPSLLLYRLSSFHNILNMLLPLYEPQSRANYAQLRATRFAPYATTPRESESLHFVCIRA